MSNDIEIRQIVKFSGEGYSKAAVTFRVGPLVIHGARLMEKEGTRWLSMPSRKLSNGNWLDFIELSSKELKNTLEKLALEAYENSALVDREIAKASGQL